MFQDLEEATKLSTFWEKECNDIKAANARQVCTPVIHTCSNE